MKDSENEWTRYPVRTTIVGGQPNPSTKPGHKTPEGLERLLSLAASSERFRRRLLADRDAAVKQARIKLTESERTILLSIPVEQLVRLIANTAPQLLPRRGFLRLAFSGVGAWLVALLGSIVFSVTGCSPEKPFERPSPPVAPTGARPDMPPGQPKRMRRDRLPPAPTGISPGRPSERGKEGQTPSATQPSSDAATKSVSPGDSAPQAKH